jgi:predicted ferric reductase
MSRSGYTRGTSKADRSKIGRSRIGLQKRWYSRYLPTEFVDPLKRQQLVSLGSLIFLVLLISPIVLWLSYRPRSIEDPIIAIAKFNAFMAISSLSLNFILAAKFKLFERLFQGLDRMYRVHKAIGRCSLLFILLHPLFLIISNLSETDVVLSYILPLGPLEISAGVVAVYIFLVLISLTVALRIPYHWWHNSHKVLGFVLVLAVLHAVLAGSDISRFPVLKYWVIILGSSGFAAWVYMLLVFKFVVKKFEVVIEDVEHVKDITDIYFKKPLGFTFQPGQYILIRFPRFEGYKELFPFSVSNDPSQVQVRISIKKSGDYTGEKVPLLKKGDKAIVMGPYGMFGERYLKHERDMIWIAGGIGITPFLSMAKHESLNPTDRKILLVWVIKNKAEAFHHGELISEAKRNQNFTYILWPSSVKGRISEHDIASLIDNDKELRSRLFFLCGPPKMMYGIAKGMHKQGIAYRHIIFEDFNMLD